MTDHPGIEAIDAIRGKIIPNQMNAAIPQRRPATEEISGLIERITFHNDESGFCVLRVKARRRKGLHRTSKIMLICSAYPEASVSSFLCSALVTVFLLLSLQTIVLGDDTKPPAINPELAAADQLYRAGKFAEAEASYQALLKADAKLVPAQVGLVRAMLRQQKIDEALDAVNTALAVQPSAAALLAAKGDVQFRRAEMPDAEGSYLTAKKLDPKEVRAYLGLARLYRSYSLYRRAYDQLQSAHEI